jgi:glycosyltransferase involved in cell wall biosynthesis
MNLSIVMAYFDRRQLLINTLKSIEYYSKGFPVELIIVDDGSSEQINDINILFPHMNINLLIVEKENKTWNNPCVAYNMGFNLIKGDVVMITCPECIHVGNIIEYVFNKFKPNTYWAFSTYAGDNMLNEYFYDFVWMDEPEQKILNIISPDFKNGWHSHSEPFYYTIIPFCGVISRKDLETLSGYDERFIDGWGCADYDLTDRIKNIGLETAIIDDPFCIHQHHEYSMLWKDINEGRKVDTNIDRLNTLRQDFPNRKRAGFNKIYVR